MAKVKMYRGLQVNYDAIAVKDGDTVYFCTDTGRCFLGDIPLSPRAARLLFGGLKVYYNGQDVTNVDAMQVEVANAATQWYGSQGAYDELVANNQVQNGVAYYIQVQADWNNNDTTSLGHIPNKPDFLDVAVENVPGNTAYKLRFHYRQY